MCILILLVSVDSGLTLALLHALCTCIQQNATTPCVPCQEGQHAEQGSARCLNCEAGTVDADRNPATLCTACVAGRYAGVAATVCEACAAGFADVDSSESFQVTTCSTLSHSSTVEFIVGSRG